MTRPLSGVFEPDSIAVVGASADPAKRGYQILRALGAAGYRGRVYPVNPKGGSLLGHQVYPSLASLPEAVDLAVLCTPAAAAPDLVRACGERGVGAAIVLAVGFKESGTEGADLERRLVEAARAGGVRVLGPNTSGLSNLHSGANLIGVRGIRPGGLALLVQSGNMALTLMNEATGKSWEGVSVCAGLGNEADIGFAEALDHLEGHEDTRGIVVYAEGFRDARAFLRTAARVSRRKPVVMIKAARSEGGARSALSHTGAVAGPYDRLRAGLRQAGVVELLRADEVLHVAETLANQPACESGTGLAILSDGGGQGTLSVDTLSELGAPLVSLAEDTRRELRGLLGPAAAVDNPVDLAGAADADPTVFARALDVLAADAGVGAVLVVGLFGGYAIRFAESLEEAETRAAQEMADCMARRGKGLVVHSMYAARRSVPLEALGRRRVPVVESLDVACRCVAELHRRGVALSRPAWSSALASASAHDAPATADAAPARPSAPPPTSAPRPPSSPPPPPIARARSEGRTLLTEPEARDLLGGYGVVFGPAVVVCDAAEAARAADQIGVPAVLKIVSGRIAHKSDAGGVRLGLGNAAELESAFEEVRAEVTRYAEAECLPAEPAAALVTRMAPAPLAELLVGAYRDPGLGPVLAIGSGGVLVEVMRDVAHRVLPIGASDVRDMLDELRIRPVLEGTRGAPPVDFDRVVETALAVATCVLAEQDVQEIEINPLFLYAVGAAPIDARVILAPGA